MNDLKLTMYKEGRGHLKCKKSISSKLSTVAISHPFSHNHFLRKYKGPISKTKGP